MNDLILFDIKTFEEVIYIIFRILFTLRED
jgi:hypothetical protein